MEDNYKEVFFGVFCASCKHRNLNESEDPCNECLGATVNLNSHKPINYKKEDANNE